MGPSETGQLIAIIILLCLSAFFSSSETALTTVNQIRMRTLADNGDKRAARVLHVTGNPGKMLSAILIGNNIVNLSASSISTSLAIHLFGNTGAGIATGILTFLILIFGEVTPKTMATIKADSMSLTVAAPIGLLMKILTPVIFIINKLSLGLMFLLHVNIKDAQKKMTEEELRTIVDVSQENGVIEHEERDMIHNLFDFGDAEAKEIMVPRIDMTFVQADATYQEVLDNLLREPYFTYEHKNTADLFLEMRKSSISLAIVLDEYGVTAGLITLEDLLEEIVGEIRDEYDADEEDDITRISDREFYVLGSANLNDVSEALSLHFTSDDYDTIGGYCLGLLDHLPEKNEIILTDNNILLRIDRMEKNRIERIYIRLPEPLEETGSEQKSEE